MSDNLSVAVTADISALQTQLAIAQADVRAYAAEVRTAANELRGAGDDIKGGLLSQLEAAAGSLRQEVEGFLRKVAV